MYVYVRMCMYMYVYVCICTYVYVYVRICMYMLLPMSMFYVCHCISAPYTQWQNGDATDTQRVTD